MGFRNNFKAKKPIVLLLCLALVAAFMLSGMTCAKNVFHCCSSSDCRICDLLFLAGRSLIQLVLAVAFAIITAITCGGLPLSVCCGLSARIVTLVCLRIRLNN